MHHAFKRAATGAALALLLAACGGSDSDGDGNAGTGGGGSGTPQSQFGSVFQQGFDRAATGEPVTGLTPASLGGVSLTADPVAVD